MARERSPRRKRCDIHVVFEQKSGKSIAVDPDLWLCVLDLALMRGWRPRGMKPPSKLAKAPKGEPGSDWNAFAYYLSSGQEVLDDDARDIARCLDAALPAVPDEVVPMQGLQFGRSNTLALIERAAEGHVPAEDAVQAAVEILSGPPKKDAQSLARFLEAGAFTIHPAPAGS